MIHPWQQQILDNMTQYKGRGLTQITGRQHGKSAGAAYMRIWNDIHNSGPIQELKLTEGTVYGKRYHCVEPVGGNWFEMEAWSFETFGKTEGSIWAETKTPMPNERWYMNNRKFWFRDEQDRVMFILRWS